MFKIKRLFLFLSIIIISASWAILQKPKPTLFIIGDSTVRNGKGIGDDGICGWGDMLQLYFDTSRIAIKNHARGGRSSRTFQSEGLWDSVLVRLKPGDFVLMQFGHNDAGPLNTGRARGTLSGFNEDTAHVVMESTGKEEIIHTYGWYMRKYIRDTRSKGAIPVVFSPVPRNKWKNGMVERATDNFTKWAKQVSSDEGAFFIDLNDITALKYEKLGPDSVKARFFPSDHTHTSRQGAIVNAESVVEGINALKKCSLKKFLVNH